MLEWEPIDGYRSRSEYIVHTCFRAKVHGGWLVRYEKKTANGPTIALTFVPDPEHEWVEEEPTLLNLKYKGREKGGPLDY